MLPRYRLFGSSGSDRQTRHGGLAFLNGRWIPLGIQTRYESILDFVRVAQDVPFVEVQKICKVIDSGDVTVLNSRLDHMLPFSAQEFLIENLLERGRT